jgi:ribose transport system substrate-binding protein
MSRLLLPVLVLMAALPLMNCGGSAHSPQESYYLVATNTKLPYWQQAAAGLGRAANQFQVRAEMVGPDSYDPKAQHEEFQRVLTKKPAGILVSVSDARVLKDDIDGALQQGVPVITIDSDAPESKRIMFIGTDNYKAGVMAAKVAAQRLNGKGNVVVYTIPEQTNLIERLHGYRDVFADYPGIKITEVVNMKGDARVAFDRTMEMMEKGEKVDGFACLEAISCPEVAEVLDRKKATGKVVVAMDTDQRTLEGIKNGYISATIAQKPYTMAFYGLKAADDLHHHPLPSLTKDWSLDPFAPVPVFVDTGATLVDKGNVDQFIQARDSATAK